MSANITRRRVLRNVAAGAAATGMAGKAIAKAPDRKIVGIEAGAGFDVARQHAQDVHRELDFGDVGKAVAGKFSDQALDAFQNNPNVRYVEDDGLVQALAQTLPWGIDRVDADVVHANGETGNGADIAIIDTGIDDDHPDLQANVGEGYAVETCSGSNCNYDWSDDDGHGTHCAGIADAIDNTEGVVGVSTEATLHAVKVLDSSGSGTFSGVAEGIRWAADQGYDVGSMSLGASSGSSTLRDAVQYANDKGMLQVAAAGNDGPCSDCVGYPAAYSEVVAVSSTDSDDSLSSFSSTGSEVELAAPGGSIYSTVIGGYDTYSGTSMACPHVSGAAGQLMANGYSMSEARSRLQNTAEDIGLSSNEQGHGLLDAEAAILDGGGGDSAPTVSWANPTDGDTVSGSVTVQISASDSEDSDDSLTVEYDVDGGTARTASYNTDTGYYEDSWDTTGVSDGDHTLNASATDSAGNTSTSSITVTVDNGGGGGGDNAPAVDSFTTSTRTTGPWTRVTGDWTVSDQDGDLDSVTLELVDSSGTVLDSSTQSVSGSSDSGSDELRTRDNPSEMVLTVTDAAGNSTTATRSI